MIANYIQPIQGGLTFLADVLVRVLRRSLKEKRQGILLNLVMETLEKSDFFMLNSLVILTKTEH